jgi:hypothetical protein
MEILCNSKLEHQSLREQFVDEMKIPQYRGICLKYFIEVRYCLEYRIVIEQGGLAVIFLACIR